MFFSGKVNKESENEFQVRHLLQRTCDADPILKVIQSHEYLFLKLNAQNDRSILEIRIWIGNWNYLHFFGCENEKNMCSSYFCSKFIQELYEVFARS